LRQKISALRGLFIGLALGVVLGPATGQPSSKADDDSTASPLVVIETRNDSVRQILAAYPDTITAAVRDQLKELINQVIDFRELSRLSLGKYWNEITPKQQNEFVSTFRDLVRNSSVRKLEIYRADSIAYEPPTYKGDRAVVVTTAYKGRNEVEIDYKMLKVEGQWRVYDIVVDGVSTAQTYRDSFYKQIAKTSYQQMYDKLVKRLAEEENTSS
jgi:phospholipid transport system substrate-binding protein